ncbi:hypothetical protein MRX96_008186 [Rhipicephalus microplus]
METGFATVAHDVMESTPLASSNGMIAPAKQALRLQRGKLEGKRDQSSEGTSYQGLLVLTDTDNSGKVPLQTSKMYESEESVNDEILGTLFHPEPIRPATKSSVGVTSEEPSIEATNAEQCLHRRHHNLLRHYQGRLVETLKALHFLLVNCR